MRIGAPYFCMLAGLFAFVAFSGDLVVDCMADAYGVHCACDSTDSDSQHEKEPCSHCSCAVHMGAAVASASVINVSGCFGPSVFFLAIEQSALAGLPAAIDHPPQLA